MARPPNPISRAAQWARQKPVRASLTAVAAVVILILVAGTAMVVSAHRHEQASRRRAEQSRDDALTAADKIIEQIATSPRLHQADMNDFRRNLMAKAVPPYLEVLQRIQGDPTQDAQRARVLSNLGFIQLELGELKQAVDDFAAASEIYESLLANSPGQSEFQRRLAVASLRRGKALIQLSRLEEGKTELLRSQRLLDGLSDDPEWTDEDSANLKDCLSQLKRLNTEANPDR
jgi:tetratricopeptide (TPR) repeat protein